MAWETIKIDSSKACKGKPSVSVGYGRMTFNVAACRLIKNYDNFKFVELLIDNTRPSEIGVRFLKEATEDSIEIKRKKVDGKIVGGIDVASKAHMESIFGVKGTQKSTTNYSVVKDSECDNILIILVRN